MAKKVKKKTAKKNAKKAVKKVAKSAVKKAAKKKPVKKPAKKKNSAKAVKKAPVKVLPKQNVINPYLTFQGNCEDAFNFYKSVFGGEFPYVGRFKEMPPMEGQAPLSEATGNLIMHISLPIGNGTVLMGSDTSEEFGHVTNVGNNFSIMLNTKSREEADRLYQSLSEGGRANMPMNQTFWGSYFGMLIDKYNIQWMVSYSENEG